MRSLKPIDELARDAHSFLHWRDEATRAAKLRDKAKAGLKKWIEANGRTDGEGHRHFDFPEPVTIGDETYAGVQAQRRTSSSIDEEAAEELARARGIYDEVFPEVTTRAFDMDALYVAYQKNQITEEELDGLISENVTWAIVPDKK